MIHIKVQYDALNRTLKLVDRDFRTLLEDDGLYDLAIPLMFEEGEVEDFISATNTAIAHA